MSKPRIVFMGSPAFVVPVLEALHAAFNVVGVYSQPPRPAGRGQKLQPTPVQQAAEKLGLATFTPAKLKDEAFDELAALKPDFICVAAYGLILRENVLNLAPCLNIHPSTLPRWRGAAPIHHTILSGDASLDVCIMAMEKGLDTGPVYSRTPLTIGADETTGELTTRAFKTGAAAMVELIQSWPQPATSQTEEGTTYANKIEAEDRPLNWQQPAQQVHNHIRALSPMPAATAQINDETWKILASTLPGKTTNAAPGKIVAANGSGVDVACGDGHIIRLRTMQRPGKKAQSAADICNGLPNLSEATFA